MITTQATITGTTVPTVASATPQAGRINPADHVGGEAQYCNIEQ